MIRNGRDLSPEQKLAIEGLLGRAISDQEDISIRTLQPPVDLPPARREEIIAGSKSPF